MNIINSICFVVLGVIMHLLPAYAASDVTESVAAGEFSLRALLCLALGYLFFAIGAWFLLKAVKRHVAPAMARGIHYVRIWHKAHALAHA